MARRDPDAGERAESALASVQSDCVIAGDVTLADPGEPLRALPLPPLASSAMNGRSSGEAALKQARTILKATAIRRISLKMAGFPHPGTWSGKVLRA